MLARLILIFTLIPIFELFMILWVNTQIGAWPTFGIVLATGLTGAIVGKIQGLKAWRKIKEELARGELPQDSILDGLAVLLASALLLAPGVLTDLTGLILLFPFTRAPIRRFAKKKLAGWLSQDMPSPGASIFTAASGFDGFGGASDMGFGGFGGADGVVLDITPEEAQRQRRASRGIDQGIDQG